MGNSAIATWIELFDEQQSFDDLGDWPLLFFQDFIVEQLELTPALPLRHSHGAMLQSRLPSDAWQTGEPEGELAESGALHSTIGNSGVPKPGIGGIIHGWGLAGSVGIHSGHCRGVVNQSRIFGMRNSYLISGPG